MSDAAVMAGGQCGTQTGSFRCQDTRTALRTVGCVHEHVRQVWICAYDTADLARSGHWCTPCLRHPQSPHECPLTLAPERKT